MLRYEGTPKMIMGLGSISSHFMSSISQVMRLVLEKIFKQPISRHEPPMSHVVRLFFSKIQLLLLETLIWFILENECYMSVGGKALYCIFQGHIRPAKLLIGFRILKLALLLIRKILLMLKIRLLLKSRCWNSCFCHKLPFHPWLFC